MKLTPLPRCAECLSVGCHRIDCEAGKAEAERKRALREGKALDAPAVDKMVRAPALKR